MHRSIVVLLGSLMTLLFAVGMTSACATLASECAVALLEASAQVCVDVICDEGGDDDVIDEAELDAQLDDERAARRAEMPIPEWKPAEGDCEISDDDDGVHVTCADGTRADFARGGEAAPPASGAGAVNGAVVEEHAVDDPRGCPEGALGPEGDVVRQGVDGNGDGVLSPEEMTGRTVDCARALTLRGHLAIHGPHDVTRIAGRRALTGGLSLQSASLVRLELPQLQSLGGTLQVEGAPALEVLRLQGLATVGGDVVIARTRRLRLVSLTALARVGGSVRAIENPQLPQRDLEELVFRLSRRGFAGHVELAGNQP